MIYLIPTFAFLLVAVVLRYSQTRSLRKIFTIALFLCSFASFAQMSSVSKDSLIVGTIAKDTVLTVHTDLKTGAKFLVLWSEKSKKFYKSYLPKRKD